MITPTFTPQDAGALVVFLSSIGLPFIVSYIKRVGWADWQKWLLAAGVSLVLGALTAYAEGKLLAAPMSVVQAAALILSFASGIYHTAFKPLGLEDKLNPPAPAEPAPPAE